MKKILVAVCAAAMSFCVTAQDADAQKKQGSDRDAVRTSEPAAWPVPVCFCGMDPIDVVGVRFTIPWCRNESVTGFDIGFVGRSRYFEGIQLNLLRSDVQDAMAGVQIGLYNSAGSASMLGVQLGLWNEAHSLRGVQIGLVNVADAAMGLQIGIINRVESLYGFQVGGVNVIRESEYPFMPVINIGFDTFTDPRF